MTNSKISLDLTESNKQLSIELGRLGRFVLSLGRTPPTPRSTLAPLPSARGSTVPLAIRKQELEKFRITENFGQLQIR